MRARSVSSDGKRLRRQQVMGLLLALGILLVCGWSFLALTNPVLLINSDPNVEMFVDGKAVQFEGGLARLHPWKRTYIIEIKGAHEVERRRIHPWSTDSASVVVDKAGVHFNIVTSEVK